MICASVYFYFEFGSIDIIEVGNEYPDVCRDNKNGKTKHTDMKKHPTGF